MTGGGTASSVGPTAAQLGLPVGAPVPRSSPRPRGPPRDEHRPSTCFATSLSRRPRIGSPMTVYSSAPRHRRCRPPRRRLAPHPGLDVGRLLGRPAATGAGRSQGAPGRVGVDVNGRRRTGQRRVRHELVDQRRRAGRRLSRRRREPVATVDGLARADRCTRASSTLPVDEQHARDTTLAHFPHLAECRGGRRRPSWSTWRPNAIDPLPLAQVPAIWLKPAYSADLAPVEDHDLVKVTSSTSFIAARPATRAASQRRAAGTPRPGAGANDNRRHRRPGWPSILVDHAQVRGDQPLTIEASDPTARKMTPPTRHHCRTQFGEGWYQAAPRPRSPQRRSR